MISIEKLPGRVALVYLDNPPLNILTLDMTQSLIRVFSELEQDDQVRAVVITGRGEKAFCVGADIKEFESVRDQVIEKKLGKENEALLKIVSLSKPVIAAINGFALGGGCEIALACDIRIIADNAKIGLPEIKLGVFPGSGGIYRLPKIVGISHAMEMMYLGEPLTAVEAFRIGLVNKVVAFEHTIAIARNMAETIAHHPKQALAAIKAGVRKAMEITEEEAIQYNLDLSDQVFKSRDCEEGIKAFFEKRPPHFE